MTNDSSDNKPLILYVDDEIKACEYFARCAGEDYEVLFALSVDEALDLLKEQHSKVYAIITDYSMPVCNGGELIWEASRRYPDIVRVLITAFSDKQTLMGTINYGGVYKMLEKPLDRIKVQTLLSQVCQQAEENFQRRALIELVEKDPLTRLYNRRYFDEALVNVILETQRTRTFAGLVMLDLDGFKQINDNFGHQSGDTVLIQFSDILLKNTRADEPCFRFGGDEFAIIVRNATAEQMMQMANRISQSVNNLEFTFNGETAKIGVSLGIAMFPQHANNPLEWVAHADSALYKAKLEGKNQSILFQSSKAPDLS